jgi:hypothetical protein
MDIMKHLDNALKEIDDEVQSILINMKLSLSDKDDLMLPLVQQKRIINQTKEDITYLIQNPPTKTGGCGMSKYRDD